MSSSRKIRVTDEWYSEPSRNATPAGTAPRSRYLDHVGDAVAVLVDQRVDPRADMDPTKTVPFAPSAMPRAFRTPSAKTLDLNPAAVSACRAARGDGSPGARTGMA